MMQTLEDLVSKLCYHRVLDRGNNAIKDPDTGILSSWENKFVEDLHTRATVKGFTEKQYNRILTILNRDEVKNYLVGKKCFYSIAALNEFLSDPPTYFPIRPSPDISTNEVKYVGNNILAFRFKYDTQLKDELKKIGSGGKIQFNDRSQSWLIKVTYKNYNYLMKLISKYGLDFDEEVTNYFLSIANELELEPGIYVDSGQFFGHYPHDRLFTMFKEYIIGEGMVDLTPASARNLIRYSKIKNGMILAPEVYEKAKEEYVLDNNLSDETKNIVTFFKDYNNRIAIINSSVTVEPFLAALSGIPKDKGMVISCNVKMMEAFGSEIRKQRPDAKIKIISKMNKLKFSFDTVNDNEETDFVLVEFDSILLTNLVNDLWFNYHPDMLYVDTSYESISRVTQNMITFIAMFDKFMLHMTTGSFDVANRFAKNSAHTWQKFNEWTEFSTSNLIDLMVDGELMRSVLIDMQSKLDKSQWTTIHGYTEPTLGRYEPFGVLSLNIK